jgi:hypothetical protein
MSQVISNTATVDDTTISISHSNDLHVVPDLTLSGLTIRPLDITSSKELKELYDWTDIATAISFIKLNRTAIGITIDITILEGKIYIISQLDGGTTGHVITVNNGGTFDGTNTTATFNAQYETLVVFGVANNRGIVLLNEGSVALSAP